MAGLLARAVARVGANIEPRHWAGIGASAALHLAVLLGWPAASPPEPEPISFEVTFEPETATRLPEVKPKSFAKKTPPRKIARKAQQKKRVAKKRPETPREVHQLDAAWQAERKPAKDAPQLALPEAQSLGIQADSLAASASKSLAKQLEASASVNPVDAKPAPAAKSAVPKSAAPMAAATKAGDNAPELVEPQLASAVGEQGQAALAGLALANSTSLSASQNPNLAASGAGAQANTSVQSLAGASSAAGFDSGAELNRAASAQAALNATSGAGMQASSAVNAQAASDSPLAQGVRLAVSGVLSSVAALPAGAGALSSAPQANGLAQGGAQVAPTRTTGLAASGVAASGPQPALPGARNTLAGGSGQQAGLSDHAGSRGGRGAEKPGQLGAADKAAAALPGNSRPGAAPGRSGQDGVSLALAPGEPGSGPNFAVTLQPVMASLTNPYLPGRSGQTGSGGGESSAGVGRAVGGAPFEPAGKAGMSMPLSSAAVGSGAAPPGSRNGKTVATSAAGGIGAAPGQNASAAILNAAREAGRPTVVLQAAQPLAVKVVRPDTEIQRLDVLAPSNYCPLPLPGHAQPDNRAPLALHDLAEQPAYAPDNPGINYPVLANIRGVEGRVTVRVEVLSDGRPGKMWLKQSSGSGILDQNAQEQLKQWRFVPARKNGQPVTAWIDVPVLYRLSQSR